MKVLIVCSRRDYASFTDYMAPFVYEQAKAIQRLGVRCEYFLVSGGVRGYINSISGIRNTIKSVSPDIVHAHFGLCGLFANFQRKVPVVTTFHGSDLNNTFLRLISNIAICLSTASILVSDRLKKRALSLNSVYTIPCGVDLSLLSVFDKKEARIRLGLNPSDKYILFSKGFKNRVKNYPLAKKAVEYYNSHYSNGRPAELLEFIGYSREQANSLFNAVDCVLMTSRNEGSPQFIKEAMACNCPIVSVDVGDVKQVISGIDGCYISERDPKRLAFFLDLAIKFGRTCGRDKIIQQYESEIVAKQVFDVYEKMISNG